MTLKQNDARVKTPIANRPWFIYVVLSPIFFVLLGYVIYPLLGVFRDSFFVNGSFSLAYYKRIFNTSGMTNLQAIWNSLYISVLSVICCGIVGTGLAFLLESFEFPGRKALKAFAVIPMALPSLIGAISFDFLYGSTGIIPRGLKAIFGLSAVPFALKGISGVLVVHTFTMYTYFYLPVSAALRNADTSLEEAASGLGASRRQVFGRVRLPMLTPSITAATMLVFMISMASYTAPLIYGIDRTLTMQIVLSRTNGDLGMASAQSTILAMISVFFLVIMRAYEGRRNYSGVSKGSAIHRKEVKGRFTRALTVAGSFLAVLFLMLPIFVIILISFSANGKWTTQVLPPVYTLNHYVDLFTQTKFLLPIKNSLIMSLAAAAGNVVFGVAAAYFMSRRKFAGRGIVDKLIMLPWSLPGTVVGISLIVAFNIPTIFSFGQVWVGTYYILPIAYFVRHLPLVYRSTCASFAQTDASCEEAARGLGANWFFGFFRVVLPMVAGGVASGAILGLVQGVGEFVASILLYTSKSMPISVAINQQMYSFRFGTACAYGTLQIALVAVLLLISERLKGDTASGPI
ncbi:MAG: iron ABC transporter permease [Oscillospiraceae bacterium]|jgi:iron(III) transport system permease protein|nr:iron ABC transporter permease [Oscillospiraceae bacterium]